MPTFATDNWNRGRDVKNIAPFSPSTVLGPLDTPVAYHAYDENAHSPFIFSPPPHVPRYPPGATTLPRDGRTTTDFGTATSKASGSDVSVVHPPALPQVRAKRPVTKRAKKDIPLAQSVHISKEILGTVAQLQHLRDAPPFSCKIPGCTESIDPAVNEAGWHHLKNCHRSLLPRTTAEKMFCPWPGCAGQRKTPKEPMKAREVGRHIVERHAHANPTWLCCGCGEERTQPKRGFVKHIVESCFIGPVYPERAQELVEKAQSQVDAARVAKMKPCGTEKGTVGLKEDGLESAVSSEPAALASVTNQSTVEHHDRQGTPSTSTDTTTRTPIADTSVPFEEDSPALFKEASPAPFENATPTLDADAGDLVEFHHGGRDYSLPLRPGVGVTQARTDLTSTFNGDVAAYGWSVTGATQPILFEEEIAQLEREREECWEKSVRDWSNEFDGPGSATAGAAAVMMLLMCDDLD